MLALKQRAQETRSRRNEKGYFVEEPVLAQNFLAFLQEYQDPQWELKFLRAAAEPLFEQVLAYIAASAKLTSHNKRLFRQWFEKWTAEMRGEQLRLLEESGDFLEIE